MSRIYHGIDGFLRNPVVEGFNSLITVALLTIVWRFAYLFPVHEETWELALLGSELMHYILGVLTLYILIVRIWRFVVSRRNWKKRRRTKSFSQMTKRYKLALDKIGTPLVGVDSVIYSFERVTSHTLSDAIELAHKAWDFDENGACIRTKAFRKGYFERLFACNNDIFYLIKKGDEIIGYSSVMPMENGDHFSGLKDQYDLEDKDIMNSFGSKLVYLQAIYVEDRYRNNPLEYATAIICLLNQVAKAVNNDSEVMLYAEQFTPDGEKLLRKMGFMNELRSSKNQHPKPIWCLHLRWNKSGIGEVPENASLTIDAIRKLQTTKYYS